MKREATADDYMRRIDRVMRFLAENLDEPLELDRLAAVACFSPYHFHRIYRQTVGETVADTLRRNRLSRAAGDLVGGKMTVAKISARAGHASVAAFTRAFQSAYGVPPATYRRRGRLVPLDSPSEPESSTMHSVAIRTTEPFRVAALRHVGPYMQIGTAFDRLFAWAGPRGLLAASCRTFGIFYDDTSASPPETLRSDACLVVAAETKVDGDFRLAEIAGGRHAVLRHQGPYAELQTAYSWLFGTWLPASGEEPADRPCFEEYLNNPRDLPPKDWLTDIYLPLVSR
jgi:AraC family transcriptional regulator